jgi:hypothetical protein
VISAALLALAAAFLLAATRILTAELGRATPAWLRDHAPLLAAVALLTVSAIAWTFTADLPTWADGFNP